MEKYSIFHIDGGMGKHIMATAVAKCIKNNHPNRKLIVVCSYPEIFLNLTYVDRVYRVNNTPYFYQDFIEDKDSIIFKHEPYFNTNHIHKNNHLIKNWCEMYDLNYNGEKTDLIFNIRQIQYGVNKWKRDKPILVIHTNGGPLNDQPFPYAWTRDIPQFVGQELVNFFSKDYHIIQICRNKVNSLENVEVITEEMGNMELLSLLLVSEKRILIDSCLQHAATALNLASNVIWIGTSPEVFGYDTNNNIIIDLPNTVKLPDSYLFNYNFNGLLHECPILDMNIFNTKNIINSIESFI